MNRTAAGTMVAALFAMVTIFASSASAETVRAVEYFHPEFEHYFVTASPAEIAALDSGAIRGWFRTGQRYRVDDAHAAGLAPICRFFTAAFAGKASHFFTASTAECEQLKANADWSYEGVAFYARVPDEQGNCSAGSAAMHRLYNAGRDGAPNHAYTADVARKNTLAGAGWVAEGVAFCAALATPDPVAQVNAFLNSVWDFPPKAGYPFIDVFSRVLVGFQTYITEHSELASRTFQNFRLPVPPALIEHVDLYGSNFLLLGEYGYSVSGDWLGEGAMGWDPLAGEYVLVMAGFYSPTPYDGIMWTFDNAQGPNEAVCTMGVARNSSRVDATSPHSFQPFIFTGCEMGIAKKMR
ncbi:MAG: hypothetical protein ABI771_16265 [Betaproteobacteria bacterium]